jgi:flagellar assembly protein FliH
LTDTVVHRVAFPVLADPAGRERASSADVRGHAAGYTAGLRAAQAETDALRDRLEAEYAARVTALQADTARRIAVLDAATNAMLSTVAPVLADAEASVASAAVDLAEAIVGNVVRASRPAHDATVADGPDGQGSREARIASGAEATVRRALASVDRTVPVAVRLSPADAACVAGLDLPVPVVADGALRDGDAVVDLPDGMLDARIATALDRARTALGVDTTGVDR